MDPTCSRLLPAHSLTASSVAACPDPVDPADPIDAAPSASSPTPERPDATWRTLENRRP